MDPRRRTIPRTGGPGFFRLSGNGAVDVLVGEAQRRYEVRVTRGTEVPGPPLSRLCALLVLNFFALVALRVAYEIDDLRHFGRYRDRDDLIFPYRFCDVRYGCPFPDVRRKDCRTRCCYANPLEEVAKRPSLEGRKLYLWWHTDAAVVDQARRSGVLAAYGRSYRVEETPTTASAEGWTCYELTPSARVSNAQHNERLRKFSAALRRPMRGTGMRRGLLPGAGRLDS